MPGKYFEEFEVGAVLQHSLGRTITEMDNVLFSTLTMNSQPLHLNEDAAGRSRFGRRIVNGIFTLGVAVGISVPELTEGTLVANLGYENVKHPQPMFHGDTLYVETEVVEKRESRSRPDQGLVRLRHIGRNQHGTVVLELERIVLVQRRETASTGDGAPPAGERPAFIRRSLLFMPGDDLHKIGKAAGLDADSIIMDLEDGVALNRKEAARQTVVEALGRLDFGRRERLVRLNALPAGGELAGLAADDLHATAAARPDGYVLPKVESAAQIRAVSRYLAGVESERGWPAGSIRLLGLIETARGVVNASQVAGADARLEALLFGAEDLAGDVGAQRSPAGWEVLYARSAVVTAAVAYGLAAIDTVFVDLQDLPGLEEECRFGRQLGFSGKMAIHPRQVEPINRLFSPSPDEIAQARRLVEAHAAAQAAGSGVFELDGRMVDMPMIRAAERVLARARAAGVPDA